MHIKRRIKTCITPIHPVLIRMKLSLAGELLAILVKNTTFDVFHVSFNVTKRDRLIGNIEIDTSHDFGCYGNHNFGKKI